MGWGPDIVSARAAAPREAADILSNHAGPRRPPPRARFMAYGNEEMQRLRFDLVTLRLFVAVYEERSLSKAAEREFIAPSALSKRITDMEQMLNRELFIRNHRGIEPTPLAEQMMPYVRNVMRDLAQMSEMAHGDEHGISGYVRIITTMAATCQYLPRELALFLQRYPGIRVDLQEDVSQIVADAVHEGTADLGIMFAGANTAGLQMFPYHMDVLTALVPNDHPLASCAALKLGQLLDYEIVGPRKGSTLESLILQAARELGRDIKPRMRISAFDTLCQMVHEDLGVAVVPRHYLNQINRAIAVRPVPLDETWAARQLYVCVKDLERLPVAARMLLTFLQEQRFAGVE